MNDFYLAKCEIKSISIHFSSTLFKEKKLFINQPFAKLIIYLFSNPFHTTRDHQRSRRSQWKLKLERKKNPKKNYPPWKTDHPLVHCVIKNVYPLLFFFYQFISGRNVLHRAISTVFALPESPSHPDEQKWAVTKSLNWTPPRPVYTRVRTSINKPWLVPMLRPGKASGVHVYLVWQYGFQYCPICMIHPAVSTNRFTVSTCALCTYIYIYGAGVRIYLRDGLLRTPETGGKILDQPSSSLVSLSFPFIRLLHRHCSTCFCRYRMYIHSFEWRVNRNR